MYETPIPAGLPPQAANASVLNADGSYTKALAFPMPATAVGYSAEAFIEGRIYAMSAAQPSFTPIVTRLPIASSAGVVFSFNDAAPTNRRPIVDVNRCNDCHKNLSLHGSNRTSNTELCATCHNPENIQSAEVNAEETFDFKHMIHRLHSQGFYWDGPASRKSLIPASSTIARAATGPTLTSRSTRQQCSRPRSRQGRRPVVDLREVRPGRAGDGRAGRNR